MKNKTVQEKNSPVKLRVCVNSKLRTTIYSSCAGGVHKITKNMNFLSQLINNTSCFDHVHSSYPGAVTTSTAPGYLRRSLFPDQYNRTKHSFNAFERLHQDLCMGGPRGATGGPDPFTLKNYKKYRVLSNTGPDPLKNHKAIKPAFNVGPSSARHRNAI